MENLLLPGLRRPHLNRGAVSLVQEKAAVISGSGTTATCTLASTPGPNNLLVGIVMANPLITSVVTSGVTWTYTGVAGSGVRIWIGRYTSPPGTLTTVTWPTSVYATFHVIELANAVGRVVSTSTGTSTATAGPFWTTPMNPGNAFLGAMGFGSIITDNGTNGWSMAGGWPGGWRGLQPLPSYYSPSGAQLGIGVTGYFPITEKTGQSLMFMGWDRGYTVSGNKSWLWSVIQ